MSTNFIKHRYFSCDGRIGRLDFFVRGIIIAFIAFLMTLLTGYMFLVLTKLTGSQGLLIVAYTVVAIPHLIALISIGAKRLHDMNMSAWLLLLYLVPGVNAIWYLIMLFYPGKVEGNNYGSPMSG